MKRSAALAVTPESLYPLLREDGTFDQDNALREAHRHASIHGARYWAKFREMQDAAARAGTPFRPGEEPSYYQTLARFLHTEDAEFCGTVAEATAEHRAYIAGCLRAGKPVPAHVLADFPGIEHDTTER